MQIQHLYIQNMPPEQDPIHPGLRIIARLIARAEKARRLEASAQGPTGPSTSVGDVSTDDAEPGAEQTTTEAKREDQ